MQKEYRQKSFQAPPGALSLLLVRHGESEAAIPGKSFPLVDGHGDPALHPKGHEQAEAVAERLEHDGLDAVYVTTLRRTHQTAAPLAARLGIKTTVERDLREICLGEWDGGLYRIKMAEGDPIFHKVFAEQEWGHVPGAETTECLHTRVKSAILRLAGTHPDEHVAAFVHGGVIGAAMSIATGAAPFAFLGAENGSITHLVITNDAMIVRGFNDCTHLAEL
ncbi:MAG: histidine phosphatase family protein [Pseudomonadota bacterium]